MVHLNERFAWMGVARGWLLLVVTAYLLAGCHEPLEAAPQACASGEAAGEGGGCEPRKPCVPGELTLASGECQPAGLPPDMQCPPGELALADGGCQPAGLPPDMQCPPGELALADGGCQPAGVPPEACGEGFMPDGHDGCEPILPAEACPPGLMAVPGETSCREVAPCGDGPWGSIPVEANTQFVDQAYAGGDSDGTATRPWTSVQDGVDAAEDGAIVAVTDGTYLEDVLIEDKAVRLWGRCPGRVEIRGTAVGIGAIEILTSAEVRSLSVTGAQHGIIVSGASSAEIEAVWIHDAARRGLYITDAFGPTGVVLIGALIEMNREGGVFVSGARAQIESTVVRYNLPVNGPGRGIGIQNGLSTGERANVKVHGCLVERNHGTGVFVAGSDAEIDGTVIRATQPDNGNFGRGIGIQDDSATGERASVSVHACVVEQNHDVGVFVAGSKADIEATVVRSTKPVNGENGRGIEITGSTDSSERADVSIRSCLVDQNHGAGALLVGSDAEIVATVFRHTQVVGGYNGWGIGIFDDSYSGARADAIVRGCLIEQNHGVGVLATGSNLEIEGSVVRATEPAADEPSGWGIIIQVDHATGARAGVSVRTSLIEQNHVVGVHVAGSDAEIEETVVRHTQPGSGEGGRGINVEDDIETGERSDVSIRACLIEQNHEVGLSIEGSDATIDSTVVHSTQPLRDEFGRGIVIQHDTESGSRGNASLRACLIEQNHEIGIFIAESSAQIDASVVRATRAINGDSGAGILVQALTSDYASASIRSSVVEQNRQVGIGVVFAGAVVDGTIVRDTGANDDATFGDGITIENGTATIHASEVTGNARAGISNWGSEVEVISTAIICNTIDINGESHSDARASFEGSSDWHCSRADAESCGETATCTVMSAQLEPPPLLEPQEPAPQY